MKLLVLLALLSLPMAVIAQDHGTFELRAVADPSNSTAKRLPYPSHLFGEEETVAVDDTVLLDSASVESASVKQTPQNGPEVLVTLTPLGAKRFGEITTALVGKRLAIIVDGVIQLAPRVNEPILAGSLSITAKFSQAQAKELAVKLDHLHLP